MEEHDEYADKTTLVRSTQRSRFGSDGILRSTIVIGTELMAEDARETLPLHSKQIGGKKLRVFIDPADVKFTTKEVRDAFSREDTVKYLSAVALLVADSMARFLGNLSLAFGGAKVPVKFFPSEDAAIQWLQKFSD